MPIWEWEKLKTYPKITIPAALLCKLLVPQINCTDRCDVYLTFPRSRRAQFSSLSSCQCTEFQWINNNNDKSRNSRPSMCVISVVLMWLWWTICCWHIPKFIPTKNDTKILFYQFWFSIWCVCAHFLLTKFTPTCADHTSISFIITNTCKCAHTQTERERLFYKCFSFDSGSKRTEQTNGDNSFMFSSLNLQIIILMSLFFCIQQMKDEYINMNTTSITAFQNTVVFFLHLTTESCRCVSLAALAIALSIDRFFLFLF